MGTVRRSAVSGQFYPAEPTQLRKLLTTYLDTANPAAQFPKALIAPHAGFVYSGPIAASAYAALKEYGNRIERVVLLGPAHRVAVHGLAASSAVAFDTPLGKVEVDRTATNNLLSLPQVRIQDDAHRLEHSLEVHLPFLQVVCGQFKIVPLAVGMATKEEVAEVLEQVWGGEETLIVISSDLSHYHDYETAKGMDEVTSRAIEELEPERIRPDQACGRVPIQGLLQVARIRGLKAITLDLRNSGDTAGPKNQVVGYGAFLFA